MHRSTGLRASPEAVAKKVVRVFLARHPRHGYHVAWDSKLSALVDQFAPVWLVDRIILRRLSTDEDAGK